MNRMVRLFVCSLNLIEQKIPKHNFWKLQVAQGIRHLFISPIHMGYFSTQLCLVLFHLKIREIIVFHLCYTKTFLGVCRKDILLKRSSKGNKKPRNLSF